MENKEFLLKQLGYFKVTLEKIESFDDTIQKILVRIDEFKAILDSQSDMQINSDKTHMIRLGVIVTAFDYIHKPLYRGLCDLLVDDDVMSFLIGDQLPGCKLDQCTKELDGK